jgi:hypothetical protein
VGDAQSRRELIADLTKVATQKPGQPQPRGAAKESKQHERCAQFLNKKITG